VSGPGQTLQDDTLPDPAGWAGRSWFDIIFYTFSLKCLFLKCFQAENAFFPSLAANLFVD